MNQTPGQSWFWSRHHDCPLPNLSPPAQPLSSCGPLPHPCAQVLVTPTPDLGKVLNAMQGMRIEGDVNLATSVQIAQLALKHRQNKNQRQRVVIFVGSPIAEDKARRLLRVQAQG